MRRWTLLTTVISWVVGGCDGLWAATSAYYSSHQNTSDGFSAAVVRRGHPSMGDGLLLRAQCSPPTSSQTNLPGPLIHQAIMILITCLEQTILVM